jgi:D-lactate dehydrogenase (cytochrome)
MDDMLAPNILSRFAAIVGEKNTLSDPRDLEAFVTEPRGLYHGTSPLLLRPGSVAEVSAILKLADETRTPVVPQGGNTGMVGGQVPQGGEIIVSLTRLDKIREIDPSSNTLVCEAGVVLAKAQEAAAEANRIFPLSLGAEGSCTIGGNLSTNAGGTAAIVYGTARDLVVGLEVVLAGGRVLNGLNKLKKDNTGYDLKNLFVGAEGTLGIITAAVLKLYPRPRAVETAFVGLPSPQAALDLLNIAHEQAGNIVTSFELIGRTPMEFALRHGAGARDPLQAKHAWYVLIELSSQMSEGLRATMENILSAGLEAGLVEDAVLAENLQQRESFWHLRMLLSETQKPEGGSIKHDVSVPVAAVPQFMEDATAACEAMIPGCRVAAFGHLGDGNIHTNVLMRGARATPAAINRAIHDVVARWHGSISAEHGVGIVKRDYLPRIKDPVAYDLMKTLKRTLDPNGILNPGKVL